MNRYNRLTPGYALQLAAPHTWPASVCPALFGEVYLALRGMPLDILRNIALLLLCILMQSSVNTLNDYIDYRQGRDNPEDNVEESDATLVYSGIDPKHALYLGIAYLLAGALLGTLASLKAWPAPFIIGGIGAAVVVLYSAGPLPVASLPLGELVSGVVMGGFIPLGIASVSDGRFHPELLFWSLPLIIGIALIMLSNNGCDIEKDMASSRTTLPVVIGRERSKSLYHFLVVLWLILLCILPPLLTGLPGLLCPLLIILAGRGLFHSLLWTELSPEGRIALMKNIAAANVAGNGAYILAIALGACLQYFNR